MFPKAFVFKKAKKRPKNLVLKTKHFPAQKTPGCQLLKGEADPKVNQFFAREESPLFIHLFVSLFVACVCVRICCPFMRPIYEKDFEQFVLQL